MKHLIPFGLLSHFIISSTSFALGNPVQGFYGGLLAGISHGPSNELVTFREPVPPPAVGIQQLFTGNVTYDSTGAGGGGMLGYKLANFRVEGELLYNRFSTGPLQVGTCVLENTNIVTPGGFCPQGAYDNFAAKALGYQGSSTVTYGYFNLYYDIFTPYSNTNLVPYIGLGIGEAYVKNSSNFVNTNTLHSHGNHVGFSTGAAQGIVGLSYYMDDFTWGSMDLRYSTTKKSPLIENKSYNLMALMFVINFAFDKGGIDLS